MLVIKIKKYHWSDTSDVKHIKPWADAFILAENAPCTRAWTRFWLNRGSPSLIHAKTLMKKLYLL